VPFVIISIMLISNNTNNYRINNFVTLAPFNLLVISKSNRSKSQNLWKY